MNLGPSLSSNHWHSMIICCFKQTLYYQLQTINDVITGIVFYGTRLYMQDMDSKSKSSHSTALVLLNTRNIEGYQSINDMLNTKAKGPWGNKITFLHVPIPKLNETRISTPLEFIRDSHNIIKRKKQSLGVVLTGTLLDIEGKLRGQEVGRYLVYLAWSWSWCSYLHFSYQ